MTECSTSVNIYSTIELIARGYFWGRYLLGAHLRPPLLQRGGSFPPPPPQTEHPSARAETRLKCKVSTMVSASSFFVGMAVANAAVGVHAVMPRIDAAWNPDSAARALGDVAGLTPKAGLDTKDSPAGPLPLDFLDGASLPHEVGSGSVIHGRSLAAPDWTPTFLSAGCKAKVESVSKNSGTSPTYCADKLKLINETAINSMSLCSASANSTSAECAELSKWFDWQDCVFKEGYEATYNSAWKASAKKSLGDDCNDEEIIAIGLALSSTSRMVDGYSTLLKAKV